MLEVQLVGWALMTGLRRSCCRKGLRPELPDCGDDVVQLLVTSLRCNRRKPSCVSELNSSALPCTLVLMNNFQPRPVASRSGNSRVLKKMTSIRSFDGFTHRTGVRNLGCSASQTCAGTGAPFSDLARVQCTRMERDGFFHESVDLTRGLGRTAAGGRRAC